VAGNSHWLPSAACLIEGRMRYLLDTNACVAILRAKPKTVATHLRQAASRGDDILLSSIVLHELWYGVYKSSRVAEQAQHLANFLTAPMEIVVFDEHDAKIAGEIRGTLESAGNRIGAFDTLIAAQCLHQICTLVTANVSEFSRVKGLKCEDWTT
jgi:tRNA(fMet)-specific endonuclease VapC